jgi:Xaa-Pro aminopeptidase
MAEARMRDAYLLRVAALQQRLARDGIDAALLTDEANIAYFSGYAPEHFFLTRSRMIGLIVPARGTAIAVVPDSHARDVREQTGLMDLVVYRDLRQAPIAEIAAALADLGARRVGLELGCELRVNMTALDLALLRARIHDAVVDISATIWALRSSKSAEELACIEQACRIGEQAWAHSLPAVRAGDTERTVAARLAAEIATLGGQVAFLIITSGAGAYHRSNGAPRERQILHGDFVFVDLGVRYEGYHADFNRCFVLGIPSPEQRALQERVRAVTEHAAGYLVPGATAAAVYAQVLDDCRQAGLAIQPPGRVGHGLGLGVTEPPHISAEDMMPLVDGLVTTIEPALEREDGLYCAECIYVVTASGGRRLNAGGAPLEAAGGVA